METAWNPEPVYKKQVRTGMAMRTLNDKRKEVPMASKLAKPMPVLLHHFLNFNFIRVTARNGKPGGSDFFFESCHFEILFSFAFLPFYLTIY
jgi:hypothetical protein